MRSERLTLEHGSVAVAGQLRALVPGGESVRRPVAEILEKVRSQGDRALLRYTSEFDLAGAEPGPIQVSDEELDAAAETLDPVIRRALDQAIANVRTVASAAPRELVTVDLGTHRVRLRREPVSRAAVYVPGGRAAYPSTVAMGVTPARVAGVREVVVCTPPSRDGSVPEAIAAACRLAGATRLYRMGGAQAIAALAYGTETVDPVEVIVGPGNLYVQEAKRQVYGQVGIDGFAGPSDLAIIADRGADPDLLTLDLLAQAEHGQGTLVALLSDDDGIIDAVGDRLAAAGDTGAVAALVRVADLDQALAVTESFAPEHLQLIGEDAEGLAPRVTRAGALLVGSQSATAFGDYIAGSNHILPTAGAARFASGLTPEHFLRSMAEVRVAEASPLARQAGPLARAEGFELHARSMEARIRQNPPR